MNNIEQVVQHARSRFDHSASRRVLKEKYQAKMLFAHNNGLWKTGPELISLLSACTDDEVVLLDVYDTPIKINVSTFKNLVMQHWQEQMNAWLQEYEMSRKNR
jgi:hypothetical protein